MLGCTAGQIGARDSRDEELSNKGVTREITHKQMEGKETRNSNKQKKVKTKKKNTHVTQTSKGQGRKRRRKKSKPKD